VLKNGKTVSDAAYQIEKRSPNGDCFIFGETKETKPMIDALKESIKTIRGNAELMEKNGGKQAKEIIMDLTRQIIKLKWLP